MKPFQLILLISFPFLCFGQDILNFDTTINSTPLTTVDTVISDSIQTSITIVPKKSKNIRKRIQKQQSKLDTAKVIEQNIATTICKDENNNSNIRFLLIIALLIIIVAYFYRYKTNVKQPDKIYDDEISDYVKRLTLTRREYYRNVYLKSAAWKRKRYLVLKRDKWTCVYCGGRATQVHHLKYAKRNIGKEPIDWLVSICGPCHDSKH